MDCIARLDSPLGPIALAGDGVALTGLWFEGRAHGAVGPGADPPEADLPVFAQAARWLEIYFSGRAPDFTPPLNLRGTPFQRRVWAALREIPFGQTAAYGEIAQRLGLAPGAARAVGGAIARNPVWLIVPCHRVVGANGALTGYAGGLERKRWLLRLESGAMERR